MSKKAKRSGHQEKLEFWKEHLTKLAASGKNQAEYCRGHDLKWFQLHYWRKKIEGTQKGEGGRLRLVPIQPNGVGNGFSTNQAGSSQIRLSFDGIFIEINDGFKPETLGKVIEVLRRSRC